MIDLNTCRNQYALIPTEYGEIWKEITDAIAPGVKPYYLISSKGRIFNIYSGKIMYYSIDTKGYPYLNLRNYYGNNGAKPYRVHRLLMLVFKYFPGCEEYEIDHIDCNKQNFNLSNLRWCTKSENTIYSYQNGHSNPKGEDRPSSTISNETARIICEKIEAGEIMIDIANELNISKDIVYSISNHKAWNHISKDYDFNNKHKSCFHKQ